MFISDYFELDDSRFDLMCSMGVFDALLDKDNNFFINIIRLKQSTVPEFVQAYKSINCYFSNIATLLDAADSPSIDDPMYRSARKKFHFHEVNGINLGFSKSGYGSGWGEMLSEKVLQDAYQIVKKGSKQPEIFHLVSLFEENVGPDRVSDMIATIIENEIKDYTLRIMKELNITPETCPNVSFLKNGLVKNPNKRDAILLLPEEILHELPIAKDWDDIDRVVSENNVIRKEISNEISTTWKRWASSDKKAHIKEHIFMEPDICSRVIDGYRNQKLPAYDFKEDVTYLTEFLLKKIKKSGLLNRKIKHPSSIVAMQEIINIFKDWVENNRGWALIQSAPSAKREKAIQRFMHLGAKNYIEINDIDVSFEPNEGPGPVDIKISRGSDKTIAEIKLSSNGQYLHGYEAQIIEYGKAERTENLIYVFIDVGNPNRKKRILNLYNQTKLSMVPYPKLIIIDACPRDSASKCKKNEDSVSKGKDELEWDAIFEEFNLEDIPDLKMED